MTDIAKSNQDLMIEVADVHSVVNGHRMYNYVYITEPCIQWQTFTNKQIIGVEMQTSIKSS